jgi:hypothetical protein
MQKGTYQACSAPLRVAVNSNDTERARAKGPSAYRDQSALRRRGRTTLSSVKAVVDRVIGRHIGRHRTVPSIIQKAHQAMLLIVPLECGPFSIRGVCITLDLPLITWLATSSCCLSLPIQQRCASMHTTRPPAARRVLVWI